MLTRFASSLPLGPVDVLFARGLSKLAPKVGGVACQADCAHVWDCGSCGDCPPGSACPYSVRVCDLCGNAFCGCGPCAGPC